MVEEGDCRRTESTAEGVSFPAAAWVREFSRKGFGGCLSRLQSLSDTLEKPRRRKEEKGCASAPYVAARMRRAIEDLKDDPINYILMNNV